MPPLCVVACELHASFLAKKCKKDVGLQHMDRRRLLQISMGRSSIPLAHSLPPIPSSISLPFLRPLSLFLLFTLLLHPLFFPPFPYSSSPFPFPINPARGSASTVNSHTFVWRGKNDGAPTGFWLWGPPPPMESAPYNYQVLTVYSHS